jgi:23S rRNA maturation-related 3'-5' exoribonuclease YhaM
MNSTYTNGQRISAEFIVRAIEEKTTKTGKPYKVVELINAYGVIPGKVWDNAFEKTQLGKNVVCSIEGLIEEYQGTLSIVISSAKIKTDAKLGDYLPTTHRTPTLVFDIETVGKQFDQLNELEQDYLLNKLEKDQPQEVAESKTGLHPLFGEVAYIAMLDAYQTRRNHGFWGKPSHHCAQR